MNPISKLDEHRDRQQWRKRRGWIEGLIERDKIEADDEAFKKELRAGIRIRSAASKRKHSKLHALAAALQSQSAGRSHQITTGSQLQVFRTRPEPAAGLSPPTLRRRHGNMVAVMLD